MLPWRFFWSRRGARGCSRRQRPRPRRGPAPVIKYIAAAIAVGLATLGGGIAVGQIGAAAMAAMSENPELSGKALPFVGLAEGICLWGFIVALMILSAPEGARADVAFHVIGDEEVVIGFRFVGVPGTVVGTAEEAREAFHAVTDGRNGTGR